MNDPYHCLSAYTCGRLKEKRTYHLSSRTVTERHLVLVNGDVERECLGEVLHSRVSQAPTETQSANIRQAVGLASSLHWTTGHIWGRGGTEHGPRDFYSPANTPFQFGLGALITPGQGHYSNVTWMCEGESKSKG